MFEIRYSFVQKKKKFGESRWTRAIFCVITIQAILAISFEAVIFAFHANEIGLIDDLKLSTSDTDSMATSFANARSLLVYFILFMLAQIFTVILVVDAVSFFFYILII